jgi:hypothetical protein
MILDPNTLILDIKATDALRQWFSTVGNEDFKQAACVILGDSDIDYSLAPNINASRILDAPYAPPGVKFRLIYNGVGQDLSGLIKCFIRQVATDGTVTSLYNYPANNTFTAGATPPSLANGLDWEQITFDDTQMGFILFFETVLNFYLDSTGTKERMAELYTISVSWDGSPTIPPNWDFVLDNVNGSMLLSKSDTTGSPIGTNYRGSITIVGLLSQKTKIVTFNF